MNEEDAQIIHEELEELCDHVRVFLLHAILTTQGRDGAVDEILYRVEVIAKGVLSLINYGAAPDDTFPLTVDELVQGIYGPATDDPETSEAS